LAVQKERVYDFMGSGPNGETMKSFLALTLLLAAMVGSVRADDCMSRDIRGECQIWYSNSDEKNQQDRVYAYLQVGKGIHLGKKKSETAPPK
jgi:hypothetical protein